MSGHNRRLTVRKALAATLTCLAATGAQATAVTPDFTDLWWNPAESGWGMNLIQQADVLFATLFVYGSDRNPTWFTGSDMQYQGIVNGEHVFNGTLYRTTGTHFSNSTFSAAQVTNVAVGTIVFRAAEINAKIVYTVDGVTISKSVERQTWRLQDFAGQYRGAMIGTYSGCPANNGAYESTATFSVTQNGFGMNITEAGEGYTCNYNGSYSPSGKAGYLDGNTSCSSGASSTFTISQMRVGPDHMAGTIGARSGSTCTFTGRLGGIRRN